MRIIDADEITKDEHQHYDYMADEYYVFVRDIENAPAVDAVEVVRCRDCRYYQSDYRYCEYWGDMFYHWEAWEAINEEGFCDKGERKEDG